MTLKHKIIYEPTTTITDFFIFILGIFFSWRIFQISNNSQFHLIWSLSFFFIGLGGLLGAISHGFGPRMREKYKKFIWRLTLIFVGLTGLSICIASIIIFINDIKLYFFSGVLFLFYINRIRIEDDFKNAVMFYLPLILLSIISFGIFFYVYGVVASLFIFVGLIISVAASLIQVMRISFHKHFNHNDLFHVIQIFGMYFIFKGVMDINIVL